MGSGSWGWGREGVGDVLRVVRAESGRDGGVYM